MPNLEVKCTVSNCLFHEKGNICGAEKIEINMDKQANKNNKAEFGSDFDLAALKKAATSTDTCCNTFTPKKGFNRSKKE